LTRRSKDLLKKEDEQLIQQDQIVLKSYNIELLANDINIKPTDIDFTNNTEFIDNESHNSDSDITEPTLSALFTIAYIEDFLLMKTLKQL